MIFKKKPADFNLAFRVVGCFVECEGKVLLLLRNEGKPEGGTWGMPAGKMLEGESTKGAMTRELFEETGLNINKKDLSYCNKTYVRFPDYDFVYYMFHTKITDEKKVKINDKEHKEFVWAFPDDTLKMNLILDQDHGIKSFYGL